ncbi:RCC1 domain-containing protein 1 [Hyla sarda]|uniref:RCC1 domain-containing protein 1 n=1 Tax=Hyla sarda TaxID=327740 RepID=UPI0024C336DA|nr:RCC1 domain-containing protein 1 [Hyla sarda]
MLCFGFGFSRFGQFGSGAEVTRNLPVPVQGQGADTEKKSVLRAVPSWSYNALLTDEGSLLLSGWVGGSPQQLVRFPEVSCRDVLPSEKYLIVLMEERAECWEVGSLDCAGTMPDAVWKKELDDGHSTDFPLVSGGHVLPHTPFFKELPPTLQAQKMALGQEHAVLLTSDGTVLTWGAGRHGQLGHGDVEDVAEPRIVEALQGVTMCEVGAGGWHSGSISESGDLYCWGWNESGQLGLPSKASLPLPVLSGEGPAAGGEQDGEGEYIAIQSFPALIDLPQESEAAKVSCGSRHTAAVTRKDLSVL